MPDSQRGPFAIVAAELGLVEIVSALRALRELDLRASAGEGSYASDERIDTARLPERSALLALLLLEPSTIGDDPYRGGGGTCSR